MLHRQAAGAADVLEAELERVRNVVERRREQIKSLECDLEDARADVVRMEAFERDVLSALVVLKNV